MRPNLVVPESEFPQRHIQRIQRHHLQSIELIFKRAEEALDAAVLPRATRIAALLADAEQEQRATKQTRREDRFIVRA